MAAVTIHSDFAAQENKVWHYSIVSPCISREVMRRDAMILVFWLLSFKPSFSLSSFTFVKRFFSSPSLSDIKVVSPAYLKLLIFLLTILIPACASSHPAFHMMYATYKLNKQGDNYTALTYSFHSTLKQYIVPCPAVSLCSLCFSWVSCVDFIIIVIPVLLCN